MKLVRILILTGAIVAIPAVGVLAYRATQPIESTKTTSTVETTTKSTAIPTATEAITEGSATATTTKDQLVFLIEEEKLAHDVYTKLYEKYGANVFGNILKSEQTHQGEVLKLLEARGIADPRSTTIGVFNDKALQALYNTLMAQANQSATEAYKVGVAIEEKDIADINTQLSTATDSDVITTLESLRRGSENHLRAFNRQLNR